MFVSVFVCVALCYQTKIFMNFNLYTVDIPSIKDGPRSLVVILK